MKCKNVQLKNKTMLITGTLALVSSLVYGTNKKVPYSTDDKVDNLVSLYVATKNRMN